jgi:hypothetical protein
MPTVSECFHVRVSISEGHNSSLERTAAAELVCKVPRAIDAKNEPDHIGVHHQQDIAHPANHAHVRVPPNCLQIRMIILRALQKARRTHVHSES